MYSGRPPVNKPEDKLSSEPQRFAAKPQRFEEQERFAEPIDPKRENGNGNRPEYFALSRRPRPVVAVSDIIHFKNQMSWVIIYLNSIVTVFAGIQ